MAISAWGYGYGDVSEFIVSAECHISPYKNTLLLLYFTIIIKI